MSLTLPGIYPREPRNKRKASKSSTQNTTFYYTKDIQYLLHEPLLKKFRDHKALSKKIARSLGRGEVGDATRLERNGTTKISLDHIIKERYPTFVDALRDIDDALSLLFLFANLPSTSTVPPKTIALCRRLCLEFEHYVIASHSLRKSFLSIKGIYYQATIQGQDILWLVPYKFVQRVTADVDFRIMGTFVEFYTTLLGFVNFRLYTSIGLVYPPKFNAKSDEQGALLGAFTLEGRNIGASSQISESVTRPEASGDLDTSIVDPNIQEKVYSLGQLESPLGNETVQSDESEGLSEAIDTFETIGEGADELPQPQISSAEVANLFAPFTFYLARETPREPLEFILRAFGCKRIGWDAVLGDGSFTSNEMDPMITYQIVDRPILPPSSLPEPSATKETDEQPPVSQTIGRVPGRTYIQPQWVWDCMNQGKLIRPDLYAPGAILPPHLSPWIKPSKGTYDPMAPLASQDREGEAEEAAEEEAELQMLADATGPGSDIEDYIPGVEALEGLGTHPTTQRREDDEDDSDGSNSDHGMHIAGSDDESESEVDSNNDFGGFEDDLAVDSPDEAETAQSVHQAELEAEAAGLTFSEAHAQKHLKGILKPARADDRIRRKAAKKRAEEEEELQRKMGMMGRKKRKVMERMMYGIKKSEVEAEKLRAKRRKIEKGLQ
jgi:pescadillo protein